MTQLEESIQNHQKLVNIIVENSNEDGICRLSIEQLAKEVGKSQTWVFQAIKRLNEEKDCIICKSNGFIACIKNICSEGTFYIILNIIRLMLVEPKFYRYNEKQLSEDLKIKRRTIQAAKAYLREMINTSKALPECLINPL